MSFFRRIVFGGGRNSTKSKTKKDEHTAADNPKTMKKGFPVEVNYGVSLRHLASLPFEAETPFAVACDYVKAKTKDLSSGYRSYANHLLTDEQTKRFVKKNADVFVSYAWNGGYGKTMDALKACLLKGADDDVFVWMDFAILDQHLAASTNIDFDQWAVTFKGNLNTIGKAALVLTPIEKPIAIERSWCCFEWVAIVESKIPFQYCVDPRDEAHMIAKMKGGVSQRDFADMFGAINVEHAKAFKPSDEAAILKLMQSIGTIKVNDIVMKSLKEWLLQIVGKAKNSSQEGTKELAEVLNAGGALNSLLGHYDDAEPLILEAIRVASMVQDNDESVSALKNNLAAVYEHKGQVDKAEPLFEECLKFDRSLSDDNPEKQQKISTALNNLGIIYKNQGKFGQAASLLEECVAIRRSNGANASLASSLTNLALAYVDLGRHGEAVPLLNEAFEIRVKLYGSDSLEVARSLHDLAGVCYQQQQYRESEQLYKQSIAIKERILDDKHPDLALSVTGLAEVYRMDGKYEDSEDAYVRALTICQAAFGFEHPTMAKLMNGYALLSDRTGQKEQATLLGKQAVQIAEAALGADHPDTVKYHENWDDY